MPHIVALGYVARVDDLSTNRAHWDALARVHGQDAIYDTEALIAGEDLLGDVESAAVGDVNGLDVLHLQSHIAFDSICLARRGARVTCVDFSAESLARAGHLADRCGVTLTLVEADAMALPDSLDGRFDLVYAAMGVLSWIRDLDAWFAGAFRALRPGGRFALAEFHPLFMTVASVEPLELDFPYAFDGGRKFDEPGSYADAAAPVDATATVEYGHSLGEIVTAAVRAGLRVDGLEEHLDAAVDGRGDVLAREADGRYRLRIGGEPLPVLFTLLAGRPA
jgi:SAM-dependent methyltransferase